MTTVPFPARLLLDTPYINSSAVLPPAEGSLRYALAETCCFHAQNFPTIVTYLSRAALALALLPSRFSFENFPGESTLSDFACAYA
jgi:hypothetical protein